MRLVLNAMLYVLIEAASADGIQWRMLLNTPHKERLTLLARGRRDGIWQRIHDTLRARVRREAGASTSTQRWCPDSQSVALSRHQRLAALDATAKGRGQCKRHVLVDTLACFGRALVTTADASDSSPSAPPAALAGGRKAALLVGGWNPLRAVVDCERPVLPAYSAKLMTSDLCFKRWSSSAPLLGSIFCRRLSKDSRRTPLNQ